MRVNINKWNWKQRRNLSWVGKTAYMIDNSNNYRRFYLLEHNSGYIFNYSLIRWVDFLLVQVYKTM